VAAGVATGDDARAARARRVTGVRW
jgi:hypothetical protein